MYGTIAQLTLQMSKIDLISVSHLNKMDDIIIIIIIMSPIKLMWVNFVNFVHNIVHI